MDLLNLPMALLAGSGHIFTADTGRRVCVGEDLVRGVTGSTDRSHCETLFEEPLTVNTERVVLKYPILRNLTVEGDFGSFVMTLSTKEWYVQHASG
jgi:hypothetical protein